MNNFTNKELKIMLVACTVSIAVSAVTFKIGLGLIVDLIK